MSKKATERALAPNEAKAVIKRLRTSPRKLNLVAGLIRGMNVSNALVQLTFSEKRIAGEVKKALQSAIANAENNHNLNVDALYVKEAFVGKNIVMKRFHTRARGRSGAIRKPFSNLTIVLSEKGDDAVAKSKKKVAAKKAAPAKDKAEKPAAKKPAAKKESK